MLYEKHLRIKKELNEIEKILEELRQQKQELEKGLKNA